MPVNKAARGLLVLLELMASPEVMENPEHPVMRERTLTKMTKLLQYLTSALVKVLLVRLALMVRKGRLAHQANLEKTALMETKALMALLDHQE